MTETTPAAADEVFEAWRRHLVTLERDLVAVHAERTMFWELVEAIEKRAGETSPLWRNHYARLYLAGQSMALRRVVRGGRGEVSLGGLLKALEEHPGVVTSDRLLAIAARHNDDRFSFRPRGRTSTGTGATGRVSSTQPFPFVIAASCSAR